MALDFGFIVFLLVLLFAGLTGVNESLTNFVDIAPSIMDLKQTIVTTQGIGDIEKDNLNEMRSVLDRMILKLKALMLLMSLALIIGVAFFKGMIWSRIKGDMFSRGFFLRFLVINLVWFVFWGLMLFISLLKIKTPTNVYFLCVWFVLVHYLTLVLFSLFREGQRFRELLKEFMGAVFRKNFIRYVLVLLLLLLVLHVWINILAVLGIAASLIGLVLFLIYLQWSRTYFYCNLRKDKE